MHRASLVLTVVIVGLCLVLCFPKGVPAAGPQVIKGTTRVPATPADADTAYQQGVKALQAGKYRAAIKILDQVVRLKPDLAEAFYQLGLAHAGEGNFDKAVKNLQEALRLKPALTEARVSLGEIYGQRGLLLLREGEPALAEAQLKAAVNQDPQNDGARSNLGVAQGQQGHWAQARESFQQAVVLNPNNVMAQYNLGLTCYLMGDKEATTRQYAVLTALDPEAATELFSLIQNTSMVATPFRF